MLILLPEMFKLSPQGDFLALVVLHSRLQLLQLLLLRLHRLLGLGDLLMRLKDLAANNVLLGLQPATGQGRGAVILSAECVCCWSVRKSPPSNMAAFEKLQPKHEGVCTLSPHTLKSRHMHTPHAGTGTISTTAPPTWPSVICDTREANLSVLTLSKNMLASGEMCMNIMTLALPCRESCSSCVSLLFL